MIRLERATDAASGGIYRVMRETWEDTYGRHFSADQVEEARSTWLDALQLESALEDANIFFELARDETSKILGFVAARTLSSTDLYVLRLYVHPEHQRRGIGSALMNAVRIAFPKSGIRLDVEERNDKGMAFWQQQGFQQTGRKEAVVAGVVIRLIEMANRRL